MNLVPFSGDLDPEYLPESGLNSVGLLGDPARPTGDKLFFEGDLNFNGCFREGDLDFDLSKLESELELLLPPALVSFIFGDEDVFSGEANLTGDFWPSFDAYWTVCFSGNTSPGSGISILKLGALCTRSCLGG